MLNNTMVRFEEKCRTPPVVFLGPLPWDIPADVPFNQCWAK